MVACESVCALVRPELQQVVSQQRLLTMFKQGSSTRPQHNVLIHDDYAQGPITTAMVDLGFDLLTVLFNMLPQQNSFIGDELGPDERSNSKTLVLCFDGTGNKIGNKVEYLDLAIKSLPTWILHRIPTCCSSSDYLRKTIERSRLCITRQELGHILLHIPLDQLPQKLVK